MRNQQEESSGENVLKGAPAMHRVMGCAQCSSVSGSVSALIVGEITGSLCAIWALALQKGSERRRNESDVDIHRITAH